MSRYLVDVNLTVEVDAPAPDFIDEAVEEFLFGIEGLSPSAVSAWRTGEFTVVEEATHNRSRSVAGSTDD